MFAKAVDILFKSLSKQELIEFHEKLDSDPHNSFLHEFAEKLSKVAPEVFD